MRFKLKSAHRKNGETKTVKKFALFPKKVDNQKYMVWLEHYYIDYEWTVWMNHSLKDGWEIKKIYSQEEKNKMTENTLFN